MTWLAMNSITKNIDVETKIFDYAVLTSAFSLQHAGEIYGEKAILATELKELQSRLSSLSGERDKSLAILDEVLNLMCLFE